MIRNFRLAVILVALLACTAAAQDSAPASSDQGVANDPQSGPYRVGGAIGAPRIIHNVDPEYSRQARKARYQGTVVLWLVVDARGLPESIKVQRSLGMGLDEEAVKAVRQWRFQPAMRDGQPVSVIINVEINFRLYETLSPHPDSAGQPPQFPGIDALKYPLIVRVGPVSYSQPGDAQRARYDANITEGERQREITISCNTSLRHCLVLDEGTYPARWKENAKTLEILGVESNKAKWKSTEYSVDAEGGEHPN